MLRQRLLSVDTLLLLVFGHVVKLGMQASRCVRAGSVGLSVPLALSYTRARVHVVYITYSVYH